MTQAGCSGVVARYSLDALDAVAQMIGEARRYDDCRNHDQYRLKATAMPQPRFDVGRRSEAMPGALATLRLQELHRTVSRW